MSDSDCPCLQKTFFTTEPQPMLFAYCKIMIKGVELIEGRINSRNLIRYATAYGFLKEMIISLARIEINSTPPASFIFRGNSAFTRLFFYYLESSTQDFLEAVIGSVVAKMIDDPKLYFESIDPTQSDNENLLFENLDSVTAVMDVLGKLLLSNFNKIPLQVVGILRDILFEVKKKDPNLTVRYNTYKTVFFLRYLFIALNNAKQYVPVQLAHELPQIAEQIKTIVRFGQMIVNGRSSQDQLSEYVIQACSGFCQSMRLVFNEICQCEPLRPKEVVGINFNIQKQVSFELFNSIKPFLSKFKTELDAMGKSEVFEKVFTCSRKNDNFIRKFELGPIIDSSTKMHSFMMERLLLLQEENEDYVRRIKEIKSSIQRTTTILSLANSKTQQLNISKL
ncbi:hypothetical protein EIN_096800 [Entamoeba invadens IP1]|uniref:Ras-GAP domain-containing protein n=1 Tax=Entamoeba invadens IP1 TaxID=370355 RepID=A0A0A1U3Z4_ENTIV|nr:hypothetical protein EIN_096800 [Entamoeba invadens IP1]ELP87413.1 hypothetical protein EIN_096800 [Entamoeba invadens IP1]|eukprot:XP_004254184.1 hypothetical protein EIN_096800 [Entamoeba invadens IP1]